MALTWDDPKRHVAGREGSGVGVLIVGAGLRPAGIGWGAARDAAPVSLDDPRRVRVELQQQ